MAEGTQSEEWLGMDEVSQCGSPLGEGGSIAKEMHFEGLALNWAKA